MNRIAARAEAQFKKLHETAYPGDDPQDALEEAVEEHEEADAEVVEAAEEAPSEPAEAKDPEVDWEQRFLQEQQRFRVLQGKYNAEVPRLHSELRELRDEIAQLKAQKQAPAAAGDTGDGVDDLTEDEIDLLGDDFVNAMRKLTRREMKTLRQAFESKFADVEQRANVAQATVQQQAVYTALDRAIPNWRDVNAQEDWKSWLAQHDTLTGEQRQRLLTQAFERGDANRVVAFFERFLDESGASAKAAPVPGDARAEPLKDMAGPPRTRGNPKKVSGQPQKRIWKRTDITRLYDDMRHKRITQEVFQQREADLYQAMAEGRIE